MSSRTLARVCSRWCFPVLLVATVLAVLAVLAGTAGMADAASPSELRKFKARVIGKFNVAALATGVTRPSDAGFGDTIIVAHKCDVSFFSVAGTASAGVQALAETGSTAAFEAELDAAVAAGNAQDFWTINPPNGPTTGKGGPDLAIEEEFSCVTILVKINPSSDWFAGVSAYDLHQGGTWPTLDANNRISIELFPFDAGTLDGTEFESSTTATSPQGTIASLRNTGKFSDNRIAEIVLTMKDPALTRDVTAEEEVESIKARWGEVAAADGYHVMWKSGAEVHDLDGSAGRRDVVVGGKTRIHTITGLTGGVEYNVQVVAYNGAGQSNKEPTSESHAYATPISAPTANNTVLVGNATQLIPGTERLLIGSLGRSQFKARTQAFTTGSEPAVLGSVTLPSFQKRTNNAQADVHIYSASGVDPGARLHTLTRPDFSSLGTGVGAVTFTAPAGETITLAANTTYLVYVESVQGEVGLLHTKDDDEDPSSDEGWSIADRCRVIHSAALPNEGCQSTNGLTAALVMVLNSPLEAGKPHLSITGSQAVEGSGVQFTVSLSSALGEAVTVEYSTADDSATTADSDYTGVSAATLTFAANETEKTVTITTTADSVDEDDETFNVELSSPSENAQLGFVTAASGLIINNDQTTQTDGTLSSITLTGSDGNAVALTPTFDKYSFLYTATADSEIDSLTGVVTPSTSGTVDSILYVGGHEDTNTAAYDAVWPLVPGDNLVKFMVTSPDGSRTKIYKIHVDKAASTDATLGALAFVDNNGAITLSPAFDSATTSYTATIGAAATSVTLTGMTSFSGATMSNTHGPDTMSGVATEAAWTGESEIGITVTAEDGTTTQYYSVLATRNLEVSFGSATYTVDEGEMVEVSVELGGDPGQQVSVDLLATVSGATAADFGSVPSNVIFAAGEVARTFQFRARTDSETDDGETVTFSMNMLTAGLVKGSPDETVITINDVEATQLVAVNLGQSTYSVDEGGTVSITVTLDAAPSTSVVIPLTVTGQDGATTADYDVPTSVTVDAGDTSGMIVFSARLDSVRDTGESVKIELGALPPGYAVGTTFETAVSIADVAATVNFGAATYEGGERDNPNTPLNETEVTVTVTLSPALGSPVTIPLMATGKGGATVADYSLSDTSVTFEAGATAKTVIFTPNNDDVDDDDEWVLIEFGTLPAGVGAGTTYATTTVSIEDNDNPVLKVGFKEGTYSVSEGDYIDLMMELTAPPERLITITLQSTAETTATIDDYTVDPVVVEFAATATLATVRFTAANDSFNDDGEFVELEPDLGLPNRVGLGDHFITIVTIDDTDVPAVMVSFEHATYVVDEGESVDVKVKLSADPERTVVIPISRSEANIGSGDYSGVPMTVSFASGETEKIISFIATEDTENDDGESLLLGFGPLPLPDSVSLGTYSQSTVSITDDDVPAVTVSFEEDSYTVAESDDTTTPVKENEVAVKVKLSAAPERTVVIPISRSEANIGSGDYSGVPMTVSFASGDTEKTITFKATHDTDNDDGESVTLGFDTDNLPDGVTEGTTNVATVSITDDDFPSIKVNFERDSYTVAESDDTTTPVKENEVAVKVKLSAAPERQVTIPFTITSDTAGSTDYSTPMSVTFEANDMEKTFTFTAEHDSTDDEGESVKIAFSSSLPTGITAGDTPETVVSITDDDVPNVTVKFDPSTYDAPEGGDITVTVLVSPAPQRQVTIPLTATPDRATAADYTLVDQSVTFSATDTSKGITFTAANDNVSDDGESVTIGFGSSLPAGVTAGTPSEATVTIIDNIVDVVADFELATYTAAEGATVAITVTLNKDPERMVSIPLTSSGQDGATGDDYSDFPASVSFIVGQTSETFAFTVDSDDVDDDDESVVIGFDTLPTGVTAGTIAETTVNITDDDVPMVMVSFEKDSYTVAESDDPDTPDVKEHKVTVKVLLSADPERTVEVPLTASGQDGATDPADPPDPTDPADYTIPDDVTFGPGETSKTFELTAAGDDVDDDDESVKIEFGTITDLRVSKASPAETTVAIADDDHPSVKVSFSHAMHTVAEGAAVDLTVSLDVDPERELIIQLVPKFDGGATDADYTGVPTSVTLSTDKRSETITFMTVDDSEDDDDDQVTIGFGTMPDDRVSAGDVPSTEISITDDDDPQVTVKFGAATYIVPEGGSASVTVHLSAAPERTVTIPLTETPMNGISDGDYDGVPTNVAFAVDQTEAMFTVTAPADEEDDDDESVEIRFGELPDGVTAPDPSTGDPSTTTVAIVDGNVPDVMVKIEAASETVAEGESVIVTVTLDQAPERAVTVPLTITPVGTYSADDVDEPLPTSVEFPENQRSKSFTINAKDDDIDDDDEGLTIGLGTLPSRVSAGSPSEATIGITDNDDPEVTVGFEQAEYTVPEGMSQAIQINLSADPEREVTIALEFTTEADGATADDYSMDPDTDPLTLTFEPGGTEQSFTFTSTQDTDDDDGEIVTITFNGSLPHRVTGGSPDEAVVTIKPRPAIGTGGGGGGGPTGPAPSIIDFEWNVARDIEALEPGNDRPTGMWSYGNMLYIADNGDGADDAVYVYDLATGERVEEREFALDTANRAPRGFWSDDVTVWVSDSGQNRLFAHDLATGDRLRARDLVLAERNRDARGIWSDGKTMWVLDDGKNSLFAYDLGSGDLLAEYALDASNGDPHGIWSDGVGVWVSDDGAKRLIAYRLPTLPDDEQASNEENKELERVSDEDFKELSGARNNSPRGIWSDGDVMYVADASDGKVYSYNIPDPIDARLASLTLGGVDIGEFSSNQTEYEGVAADGVTETTVEAEAVQPAATVAIEPPDSDEAADGRQAAVAGGTEITITVTSADESRTKIYRVRFGDAAGVPSTAACLRGAVSVGFSLLVYAGGSVEELVACAQSRHATALYTLNDGGYVPYIFGAPDFVNSSFGELFAGGVPATTPLIIKSEGPPSPAPASDAVPEFGADCLRGEIASGFSLLLYEGGSVEDLDSCAQGTNVSAVYALIDGEYVPYILGAPEFVNEAFRELFPEGIAPATPLIAKSD